MTECNEATEREACDEEKPLGSITNDEIRELCKRYGLIDLCRVVLAKAAGEEGLSLQGAATMSCETAYCKLTVQRRKPPKKTRVTLQSKR